MDTSTSNIFFIYSLEYPIDKKSNTIPNFNISLKDGRIFHFSFSPKTNQTELMNFIESIANICFSKDYANSFVFSYKLKPKSPDLDGWNIFNYLEDCKRMGLNLSDEVRFVFSVGLSI